MSARPHRLLLLATLAVLATSLGIERPDAAIAAAGTDRAGPVTLTEVALEQRDVQLALRLATSGGWTGQDLRGVPGRSLCVALVHGDPAVARGRICVTSRSGRDGLSFTPLNADGTARATRRLPARVTRPAPNVFEAVFLPAAAGLPLGAYSWWAQAAWTDGESCVRPCDDRYPAQGTVAAALGLLGVPACFGAAARDPAAPCDSAGLRLAVEPPLRRAYVVPPPYCDTTERSGLIAACGFGTAAEDAAGTFAIVGDSHAAGMKTPLHVVTLAKRWRGVSILRSSCPATLGVPRLPTRGRSRDCLRWNQEMLAWLLSHPEVGTVFLSAHIGAAVDPKPGQSVAAATRAGYRDLVATLTTAGRRVVVIRDTPAPAPRHLACVARALREGRAPGTACARPRRTALRPDPLVAAARSVPSPLIKVVDLTRQFCDRRRCLAVVGGALVNRNSSHLSPLFAATLGPFLVRAVVGA